MGGSAAEKAALTNQLATFAARSEVGGVVVDLGASGSRINQLNAQAHLPAKVACPFAKNLVAQEIKGIVDSYRASPNAALRRARRRRRRDPVLPLSGREPARRRSPVTSRRSSTSRLRGEPPPATYVLSQDAYGAERRSRCVRQRLPGPRPRGRPSRRDAGRDRRADRRATRRRAASSTPTSSLVTGYDFLADAADAVRRAPRSGIGDAATADHANDIAAGSTRPWTACRPVGQAARPQRHDLMFLAGHFSANSALAADFTTSVLTTDLAASTTDFTTRSCSAPAATRATTSSTPTRSTTSRMPLDWAQAFARKRATLIAGTGYQYGDTDFIEYSERALRQLRAPVPARHRAGRRRRGAGRARSSDYLATTPDIRGITKGAARGDAVRPADARREHARRPDAPPRGHDAVVIRRSSRCGRPVATLGLRPDCPRRPHR